MSDVGLILILVVLVLGGAIATIGDRLGTRVGKARLSLFNLRPKQTAVVVTILTGTLISASTLGILLLASKTFREMLLNFGRIQTELRDRGRDLEKVSADLKATDAQKAQVEKQLAEARSERAQVEEQLKRINANLQTSINRQRETNAQLRTTEAQRDATRQQLVAVSEQALTLRTGIEQLQAEQQKLIEQRDQVKAQIAERDEEIAERTSVIEQRDREISERDRVIAQRGTELEKLESQLKELASQQAALTETLGRFERDVKLIRSGDLALYRTQVLSSGVVRVVEPRGARVAVDQLLQYANQSAIQALQLGRNDQLVQIPTAEVESLISQISDGQDYLVRVQARANYVKGENRGVSVYMSAVPNRIVFLAGDTIAAQTIDPSKLSAQDFQKSIQDLFAASNSRARVAGVLNDNIEIEKLLTLGSFIEQLRRFPTPVELRAVASQNTYTSGPLKIELVAVQNGQIVLRASS
ncbi:DUF3084 domain-containing protein [Leptolyngbya sp. AN03gr2]|uniref:DUF3084 domain-containing protein n=1 Tax=unclassified Leptolyngbya TaxID=2650499 RepID=UPI003D30F456